MTFKRKRPLALVQGLSRNSFGQRVIIAIFALVSLLSACSKAPGRDHHVPGQTDKDTAANSAAVKNSTRTQDAATICDQIPDIRLLPFHGDRGEDAIYDAFMDAGETALPCLIKKITDTTEIPDPAETLKFPETTIGDVAYFLLIDITKLGFVELLPAEVQGDYNDNGIWAYYAYVNHGKNRERLQTRLYEWYRRKYRKRARAVRLTTREASTPLAES